MAARLHAGILEAELQDLEDIATFVRQTTPPLSTKHSKT